LWYVTCAEEGESAVPPEGVEHYASKCNSSDTFTNQKNDITVFLDVKQHADVY